MCFAYEELITVLSCSSQIQSERPSLLRLISYVLLLVGFNHIKQLLQTWCKKNEDIGFNLLIPGVCPPRI